MEIQTQVVDSYLNDEAIHTKERGWLFSDFTQPDPSRKEVVAELKRRVLESADHFPTFNSALYLMLFPHLDEVLEECRIVLVVGSPASIYSLTHEGVRYLVIDLLQVANMTRIVSQMMYVIANGINFEIAKQCILKDYPAPHAAHDYHALLNRRCFIEGLATYLAWSSNIEQYRFFTEKYNPYKEKAFALLHQAFYTQNQLTRKKILTALPQLDFWNQFPTIAGMFYFDDVFLAHGKKAIKAVYDLGWRHFIQTIFQPKQETAKEKH